MPASRIRLGQPDVDDSQMAEATSQAALQMVLDRADQWQGLVNITRKAEWPDWTPPPEMIARQPICHASWPAAPATRSGRGRCIWDRRSIRIHGSNEPETIGQAVSSGCFRMTNEDVTDLYSRVSVGTTVIVKN